MRAGSPWRWSLKFVSLAAYVFLGVFLLRLFVLTRLVESPFLLPAQGDMHFYNEWARKILRGEFTDYRAFYGLPLYPYLLAGIYKVFGYNPFVPGLIQAALEGGTAALIFLIGRDVFGAEAGPGHKWSGTAIGLTAAVGWGFFMPAQSYSVIMMPTPWLVCIFWWLVWQIVKRTSIPSPLTALIFGLLIGVTATGVATILFLLPLLVAAIFVRWDPPWRLGFVRRLAVVGLLFLGVGIGTAPAWLHNRFVARDPVFLSAHSGVNFWIGNNPDANGYPRFPPGLRAGQRAMLADSISAAEAAAGHPLKRSEVSAFWSDKARTYIAKNPVAWMELLLVKITNFWNAFQYDDLSIITSLREQGVTMPGIRFGVVAALALPGMVLAATSISASRWILAAVLLHMLSLLSVFVTERYRLAAAPGLLLFAAFGIWELWRNCARGRARQIVIYAGLLTVATWFVSVRRGDVELWALDPYNSGLQALEAKHLDSAERKLNLARAYVPGNSEVNLALGNLWLARGDREKARRFYHETLAVQPDHKSALNNLGVLALDQCNWEEARQFFEAAIQVTPRDPKTHYLLARVYFELRNLPRATSEIKQALALHEAGADPVEYKTLQQEIAKRAHE